MAIIAKEVITEKDTPVVEKVYDLVGAAVAPNLGRFSVSQLEAQKVSIQERADAQLAEIDVKLAAIAKLTVTK